MKRLPKPLRRALCRTAYLLPLLTLAILLIHAAVPHVFFLLDGEPYETMSTFTLLGNTWEQCQDLLDSTKEVSVEALYFSYTMNFFVIISWVATVLFAILALSSAILSCYAFSLSPTDTRTNRAKRWMQFFCPNRPLYVITCLLPLLPAAFPYILEHFYQSMLYYDIKVYFIGPADLLLTGIAVLLTVASFLALLPSQSAQHLDMFRLYKAKKD